MGFSFWFLSTPLGFQKDDTQRLLRSSQPTAQSLPDTGSRVRRRQREMTTSRDEDAPEVSLGLCASLDTRWVWDCLPGSQGVMLQD